jgi:hydroxymethylpyrimidine kinase/phosphomethylpyrimidine kinase/thiamine-phosphate diphosphorylase
LAQLKTIHKKGNKMQEVLLTIAGSDSCSGAGIQIDTKVCQDLGVYALNVITAITAQNPSQILKLESVSDEMFAAQIEALANDFNIKVVKTGVIANEFQVNIIYEFLNANKDIIYICDPVMIATSGDKLMSQRVKTSFKSKLLPRANILTPNLFEAQELLGINDLLNSSAENIKLAAKQLSQKYQIESIFLKGGHAKANTADDYFYSQNNSYWLSNDRINTQEAIHGTGCTISAAIGAFLVKGYDINNSLVLAKSYISASIKEAKRYTQKGSILLKNTGFPRLRENFAKTYLSRKFTTFNFKKLYKIGFYPIVDSSTWVKYLAQQGIKTIQLRIKDKGLSEVEKEIKKAVEYQEKYNLQLFINDYYQLALKYKAFGVHLGHEDIVDVLNNKPQDLQMLVTNNLALGLSTHDYFELSIANAISPSYIALGPIFPTNTKVMRFAAQGINRIKEWQELTSIPLVAIGGIKESHIREIASLDISGIAAITLVTLADDPKTVIENIQLELSGRYND